MGDTKAYWIAFHRVPGIGGARIRLLLSAFGNLERAWRASADEMARAGLGPVTLRAFLTARRQIDPLKEEARARSEGYSVLTWEDEAYPRRLREIAAPPPVLYVWGEWTRQDETAVAVVGTRTPTGYGLDVAQEFGAVFAQAGVTVISGLAKGIDIRCHRAVLESGGRTVAVLGAGLDFVSPWEHRETAAQIAGRGAVISDYPLGTPPEPRNFPPRNRLISGLAQAVVVVEAGEESGALLTAEFAAAQARPVYAVPGPIHSRKSRGTNRLIAAGARPALSAQTVLEDLQLGAKAAPPPPEGTGPVDPREKRVWEALGEGPVHVDDLSRRVGLPAAEISASLSMMELRGQVRAVGGMQFVRARTGPPAADVR